MSVSVAFVRIEGALGRAVVFKRGNRAFRLGTGNKPTAHRATPPFAVVGLDPDHVSNHGCHPARMRGPRCSPDGRKFCAPKMVQSRTFFTGIADDINLLGIAAGVGQFGWMPHRLPRTVGFCPHFHMLFHGNVETYKGRNLWRMFIVSQ